VLPSLQVVGHPDVYAIGDLAQVQGERLPLIAPVAIQQGEWAAANILRHANGEETLPFRYRDPGSMVAIGRNAAVVRLGGRSFTGFIAWLMWLGVHILKLIGFRNRILVLVNWAWDYLFYERAVRLIFPRALTDEQRRQFP
jgi:NADH dehydrogenase